MENLILGHSIVKIDAKRRIFLPKYTPFTNGDEVVLEKGINNNELFYKIYSLKMYLDIFERFKSLRDNAVSFSDYDKYNRMMEDICMKIEKISQVDVVNRILLPKTETWSPGDFLQLDGLGESLLVRKKK